MKNVVQDLTSAGLLGVWGKWMKHAKYIMQFGDRVLVAQMNWNGMLEGAVYGFVEDPEEGWSPIECRLELLKISEETYTDAGHAGTHTEKRAEFLRELLLVVVDSSGVKIHINMTKRCVYDCAA